MDQDRCEPEEPMMTRGAVDWRGIVLAGVVVMSLGSRAPLQAGEDARTALQFLQDLRGHGLHDLALEYIHQLRDDAAIPTKVKDILDFEEGRTLIDEAAKSGDLALREDLLRDARDKLESFVKAHPQLSQARDAMIQTGKLLLERGHVSMMLSDDAQDPAKKAAKMAEARASFTSAHDVYGKAIEPLKESYKKFAGFLEKDDPRHAERDEIYASLLDALLQKAVADYELAESFPAGSAERTKWLKDALEQFNSLYKNYREQWAGLAARMWEAKCYEEQGDIGAAIGIYKELLGHTEPKLRALQRNVGYFHIVALGRRKQYALASDEASRWLAKYNRREELRSPEGLGVLVELGKDIDAQMPEIAANERPRAQKKIVDAVTQVVRYASPFKKDALALLKKYKPSAAVRAEELVRLTYEDAMGQADEAIGAHEWDRAILLLKAAIAKADPARNVEKANHARYNLAFCYYTTNRYYEADVIAEHLARRYPDGGLSSKVTAIGMQAVLEAYNNYTEIDRKSDLDRLIDLATYTAETWPDREEGDDARVNLGQIYLGMGQYDKAIAAFGAVRRRSREWVSAQNRLGAAHWAKSRDLERRRDTAGAEAETKKALEYLNIALKARRDTGTGATDPGFISNISDVATVFTETGKAADALALLEPIVKAQTIKSGPGYTRLMEAQLKAFIASGKVEPAIATMKALEHDGGAAGRTQLYLKLGQLLEKELEDVSLKGNTTARTKMHQAYKTFLTTLVESKTGQTFESLEWAGSGLLKLEASQDAEKVFRRILTEFTQDPQFLQQSGGRARMMRTRLNLAAALRGQGKSRFDEAESLLDELLAQKPPEFKVLFEKGLLLEAEADAGRGNWSSALRHWEKLTEQLGRFRPRPTEYYDAWYHVAWVLSKQKDNTKARQALLGVMRLSRNVGGPEMKAKYEGLLARIK
jgi:tetratricopeptide (TPR) repeat protein